MKRRLGAQFEALKMRFRMKFGLLLLLAASVSAGWFDEEEEEEGFIDQLEDAIWGEEEPPPWHECALGMHGWRNVPIIAPIIPLILIGVGLLLRPNGKLWVVLGFEDDDKDGDDSDSESDGESESDSGKKPSKKRRGKGGKGSKRKSKGKGKGKRKSGRKGGRVDYTKKKGKKMSKKIKIPGENPPPIKAEKSGQGGGKTKSGCCGSSVPPGAKITSGKKTKGGAVATAGGGDVGAGWWGDDQNYNTYKRNQTENYDRGQQDDSGKYTDHEFKANMHSLQGPDGQLRLLGFSESALRDKLLIEWKRVGGQPIFDDSICPEDLTQGSLGNCWLIAAIASMAEFGDKVREIFTYEEMNEEGEDQEGRFTCQFWNQWNQRWDDVTVDDFIPYWGGPESRRWSIKGKNISGCNIFAAPTGAETWVMILEKAFAKWCGGYYGLDGGDTGMALQAFTGDSNRIYLSSQGNGTWVKLEPKLTRMSLPNARCGQKCDRQAKEKSMSYYERDVKRIEQFWDMIMEADNDGAIICLGSKMGTDGSGDTKTTDGVVNGHAFTVIKVNEVNNFKLLQCRNPWGKGEPQRLTFSDNSDNWDRYPEVAEECEYDPDSSMSDDGIFWITLKEMDKYFNQMHICRFQERPGPR